MFQPKPKKQTINAHFCHMVAVALRISSIVLMSRVWIPKVYVRCPFPHGQIMATLVCIDFSTARSGVVPKIQIVRLQ